MLKLFENTKRQRKKNPDDIEVLREMSAADRLIYSLRLVERSGEIPIEHFRELTQTLYRLAAKDYHRSANLGITQISHGQDAIVRNLMETVIGANPFTVIDVGANDGWFLDRVVNYNSVKSILAFEPIEFLLEQLNERATRWPHISIVTKAVGSAAGTCTLNVYNRVNGLSSLLDFAKDYHFLGSWFDENDRQQVQVEVVTLDDYLEANPELAPTSNIALKIDVQGFESQVLEGATNLLKSGRVKAILIELVTLQKYSNSATMLPVLNFLDRFGFAIYDVHPFYRERNMVFQESHTGRLTEMDCLLVHNDYLSQI